MTEPGKSVAYNRDVPKKSLFSRADDIPYNEKHEKCSDKMEDSGSYFTVLCKIKLVKFSVCFDSFGHGDLVYDSIELKAIILPIFMKW